jgi:hypothetical protein
MAGLLDFGFGGGGGLLAGLNQQQQPQQPHPLGGFGDFMQRISPALVAIGSGLASSQNPAEGIGKGLQLFAQNRTQQEEALLKRLLLQHQLTRDTRDFQFREAESQRQQNNTDRLFEAQHGGKNETVKVLQQKYGLDPGVAAAVAGNPTLLSGVLGQQLGVTGQTEDIKEFEYAKKQGFTGTLEQWMQRKRAGAGEYGLQGIWGTDSEGNPAIVQLGKGGEAIQSKLPPGFKPGKDAQKVDLGTHWGILDPTTRQMVSTIPKDIAGKEAAEERGKAMGQAQVNLPKIEDSATLALKNIEQIEKHPGKKWGLGWMGVFPGVPGTDQKGFVALVDQLKGKSFLQAFETLKGAGQITEIEGQKATEAIARLDRAQSHQDFDTAIKDLKEVIEMGVSRSRKIAGGGAPAGTATQAPGGTTKSGLKWSVQ